MSKAIYPGSFDPITNGHLDVLKKALGVFDEVVVLVADNPNKKSRFSLESRLIMAREAVKDIEGVSVASTSGLTVDFAKKENTVNIIRGLRNSLDYDYELKLAREYKKMEPTISMCFFIANKEYADLSSSKIHELFLKGKDISKFVPKSVIDEYKKR